VAAGSTNREAARQPFISEATVKTHLLHISAVAAGYQRGLLVPDGG
jgi:DNA-binding CsgD family transcriptional regulator